MQFLTDKLSELNICWNERPLTEADFYRLCKRFNIRVQEMPLRVSGFYYRVMGRDFIAIDSRLTGMQKLFVMYHELGHFLFHMPESGATANFHGVGHKTRYENEADAFALCAILPRSELKALTEHETTDDITHEILESRFAILERYGL